MHAHVFTCVCCARAGVCSRHSVRAGACPALTTCWHACSPLTLQWVSTGAVAALLGQTWKAGFGGLCLRGSLPGTVPNFIFFLLKWRAHWEAWGPQTWTHPAPLLPGVGAEAQRSPGMTLGHKGRPWGTLHGPLRPLGLTRCRRGIPWLFLGMPMMPGTDAVSSLRVFLAQKGAQLELGVGVRGRRPAGVVTPRSQQAGRGRGELRLGVWPSSSQLPATAPSPPATMAQWTEMSQLLRSGQINSRPAVYSCRDRQAPLSGAGGAAHDGDERRPSSAWAVSSAGGCPGRRGWGAVGWDPEAVTSEPGLAFSSREEPGPGGPEKGCWGP